MAGIPGSLPERLFLLACDLQKNRLTAGQRLGLILRAAALADLRLRGRLADDGGIARVLDLAPTGDPLLDAALEHLGASGPRSWRHEIGSNAAATARSVRDRLEADQQITVGPRRFLLPATISVCEPGEVRQYAQTVRSVLREPASQADPYTAVALALAAAGQLKTVLRRPDRRQHRGRIRELTADPICRALRREITALSD